MSKLWLYLYLIGLLLFLPGCDLRTSTEKPQDTPLQDFTITPTSTPIRLETLTSMTPVTEDTQPSSAQPDLTIFNIYLEMEGRQHNQCVTTYTPYEIRVIVQNLGKSDAGLFIVDLNGAQVGVDNGLAVGQQIELHFPGSVPSGYYTATVDVYKHIIESDEGNNIRSYHAPTPTPPPICTGTPQ